MRDGSSRIFNHSDGIYAVRFRPDGHYVVAGSSNGDVMILDVHTTRLVQTLPGHSETVYGLAFMPDGKRLVSSSEDHTVKCWDVSSLEYESELGGMSKETLNFKGHTVCFHSAFHFI